MVRNDPVAYAQLLRAVLEGTRVDRALENERGAARIALARQWPERSLAMSPLVVQGSALVCQARLRSLDAVVGKEEVAPTPRDPARRREDPPP
eukprot:8250437-Pyramimonas_sp.AAC.1